MTEDNSQDVNEELEKLRKENEILRARAAAQSRPLSMKVSEKGALSIYGMGRFPVTLYKEQWLRLLSVSEDIKKFIKENDAVLRAKEHINKS